jgi:hypothetical protein
MIENSPDPQTAPDRKSSWARATMWMVIVFLVLASGVYIFKSVRDLPSDVATTTTTMINKAGQALAEIASAFNQGTVTTSFIGYATTVSSGHYLQFATLKQTEVFTQTDQATTAFGYVPLPELVVQATAPVEITYYLDLNGKWDITLKDGIIYVLAPPIRFNKPAVDASAITYEVRKGSILRDKKQALENLKQSITLMAHEQARERIPLVRETGRKQVSEFVEKWLAKSFSDGKNYPVKVLFPGEALPERVDLENALREIVIEPKN